MDELISILNEIGLPYAYDHFAEGESPNPPFICYLLPGSDNFAADGMVYYKINDVHIELYTDAKDPAVEGVVEAVLDEHGIFYEKGQRDIIILAYLLTECAEGMYDSELLAVEFSGSLKL